jgi:hypothetical protein
MEQRQRCQAELRQGEKMVWIGQPLMWLYRRKFIDHLLPGILVGAFAFCWIYGVLGGFSPNGITLRGGLYQWLFLLFGTPLVLQAAHSLGAFLWLPVVARRTVYLLTDQRVIVFQGRLIRQTNIQSFVPARLTSIVREERPDGNGNLIFEQFEEKAGSGTTTVRRGFFAVAQVRELEETIVKTLLCRDGLKT